MLVAGNYNLTVNFKISPSSDMRTTPAPPAFLVVDPSVLDHPCLLLGLFFFLRMSEFYNEINEDLGFDYYPRPIFYVELAKPYSPLDEAPCCIYLIHHLSYRLTYHDNDEMCLKVVEQFSGSDY